MTNLTKSRRQFTVQQKQQTIELCQLLHGRLGERKLQRQLDCWSGQLIQQGVLTISGSIEADVPQRAGALLVLLPAGDAHQAEAIAQVVPQGPGDAAAQIGLSRLTCFTAQD
jgi:hypothetical protein